MIDTDKYEEIRVLEDGSTTDGRWATTKELIAEVKRLRKTLACIAFSPDDPKWVGEKLDELAVDSDTWKRWME